MLNAVRRFLVSWVPFAGWLLGKEDTDGKKEYPTLPPARVAIIGAGVGGSFAAHFLRRQGGRDLDIQVFTKQGSAVGGRTAVIEFAGHLYESGGSILHSSNKYMVDAAKEFGLDTKSNKDEGGVPIAIYNGRRFCLRTGYSNFWNALKILWHYGFSLLRMNSNLNATLKKFRTVYNLQNKGKCYATVPELLKAMGGDKMYQLTKVSAREYMLHQKGWSQKLVDELVTAALYMNYGQNSGVNAFTGLVALAGMQDGNLWSVVAGNKQIPEKLLENSLVTLHKQDVVTVTRKEVQTNGRPKYSITTTEGEVPTEFDVVIVANPLNISSVEYPNFTTPVYSAAATTPFQRTVANFVKGKVNPAFFGLTGYDKNFPMIVLVTELMDSTFAYRSLARHIPSELPASDIKPYLKPIKESPVQVWKVFSPQPLTGEQKKQLFSEIEDEAAVDWQAYPQYHPPEEFPPFILDDGVFYINAIEKAASAMEMSAIGARNVSLLAAEYLAEDKF